MILFRFTIHSKLYLYNRRNHDIGLPKKETVHKNVIIAVQGFHGHGQTKKNKQDTFRGSKPKIMYRIRRIYRGQ